MLAPFPESLDGRPFPESERTPRTIAAAVELAAGGQVSLPRPVDGRAERLQDLRDEPVIVLHGGALVGVAASWPSTPEGRFTLRPPTREELRIEPLGPAELPTTHAAARAFLAREANRARPHPQRFSEAVLLVARGDADATPLRALATLLVREGAASHAKIAVQRADGLWGALPLRPLAPPRRTAPPPPPGERDEQRRLREALATPLPGPRCHELRRGEALRERALAVLARVPSEDLLAVPGDFTLQEHLDPSTVVGPEAASRTRLGDACD